MNIRVDLNIPIKDGAEVVFRSPVDCSQVTGLIVYYIGDDGNTRNKEFAFADAHGNNVGDIDHLFAENVAVKVILDVTSGMAFVQNADTNAYLEGRFDDLTPDDSKISRHTWSSKNTVDKLCPAFTESGSMVNFKPMEGYPLEVTSHIHFSQEGSGNPSPENIRTIIGCSMDELHLSNDPEVFSDLLYCRDFGQTVYGGTYDWHTGELKQNRVAIVLDGTEQWFLNSPGQLYIRHNITNCQNWGEIACSHLVGSRDGAYNSQNGTISAGTTLLWLCDNRFSSLDSLKSYLAEQYAAGTPVTVVISLTEPIVTQLEPAEIRALSGENHLFSAMGCDVTVTGRCLPSNSSGGGNGEPGFSPTVAISSIDGGNRITITDINGTKTADVMNGKDGAKGDKGDKGDTGAQGPQGEPGKDGAAGETGPKGDKGDTGATGAAGANGKDGVSATHSWNGTTLTVTSASGTSSANLKGEKGDKGDQGIQGIQGATGAKGDKGDKGDTGATGAAGANGKDGVSATHSWNGTTLTITSASGTSSANLKGEKGDTGATGPKGDPGKDAGGIVPDYVKTEAEAVADLILEKMNANCLVGAFVSDIHFEKSAENNPDGTKTSITHAGMGIAEIRKITPLDFVANLGDNCETEDAHKFIYNALYNATLGTNSFWLRGNHEGSAYNYSDDAGYEYLVTDDEVYKYVGVKNKDHVINADDRKGMYGYKDYEDLRLRIIYLNTSETFENQTGDATVNVVMTTTQITWMRDVALDFTGKTNVDKWKVLVLSHVPLDWNESTQQAATVLDSYASSGSGAKIIGNIHGHVHNCNVGTIGTNKIARFAIPQICADRYNEYSSYGSSYATWGEFAEDGTTPIYYQKGTGDATDTMFCVVVVDCENEKFHAITFGATVASTKDGSYTKSVRVREIPFVGKADVPDEPKPAYTNVIPLSVTASTTNMDEPYVGHNGEDGYSAGWRINSSLDEKEDPGMCCTGFIRVNNNYVRVKNITVSPTTGSSTPYVAFYYQDKSDWQVRAFSDILKDSGNGVYSGQLEHTGYIRLAIGVIDDTSIMTLDEEIV